MRLAIITTHPIQYYAPVFKMLNQHQKIEVKVFYTLGEGAQVQYDAGFGKTINWDIPLLQGYTYQFQKNTATKPGPDRFWGIKNPELIAEIEAWKADAILIYGWAYQSHLQAMRYFKNIIPIFFRGDSTFLYRKNGVKNSIRNIFLRWVYGKVNHAFFVGQNNKAYFKKFGLKENQLTFAPHAVDNDRFAEDRSEEAAAIRKKLGINPNDILVLFAGKFELKKNPEILLDAFENLNQQNIHLLYVGNGPLEKALKAKKTRLKTALRIHFLDFQNQSQISTIYQACDLFCLPSSGPGETWGLAVNEAMACGKAVLVSDKVGCAIDLVLEGKNGAIFKAGDLEDLTANLSHLCQQKALLKTHGQASAQIIQNWNFKIQVEAMQKKYWNMFNQIRPDRFMVLFLPWIFAWLFDALPQTSYLIAWLGSFFIFFFTISGWVKPIPNDRSLGEQLMRPLFLTQIIFAGYMCCTTFFYYLDILGYDNFVLLNHLFKPDPKKLLLLAECQRYYCLGHAAFASGTLLFMNYPVKKKYQLQDLNLADFLLYIAILTIPVSVLFAVIPGLNQFSAQLTTLSFIAGTLALAFAIPLQKLPNILISGTLFAFNLYKSILSGYKEPVIVSFLVLAIFLYPFYKRTVILVFVPLLLLVFAVLPTYNQVFRQNAWSGDLSAEAASKVAFDAAVNNSAEAEDSNWNFLVFRLSEVDMFVKYIQSTPKYTDFYGSKIIVQSLESLVPRAFWPAKPNTEDLVMERAFNAGIAAKGTNVSAKPALIADAYLFKGGFGIFLILFLYGIVNQLIALKAESLFGGYILGTALIYSGLFQIMWRGLSFEFLLNSVF